MGSVASFLVLYTLLSRSLSEVYLRGHDTRQAFLESSESITGKISKKISTEGIIKVYEDSVEDKAKFEAAYSASYKPSRDICEVYDEVASGNEIRSIIMAGDRHNDFPWVRLTVHTCRRKVPLPIDESKIPLNPTTAGVYVACMMAQIDVLLKHGHSTPRW